MVLLDLLRHSHIASNPMVLSTLTPTTIQPDCITALFVITREISSQSQKCSKSHSLTFAGIPNQVSDPIPGVVAKRHPNCTLDSILEPFGECRNKLDNMRRVDLDPNDGTSKIRQRESVQNCIARSERHGNILMNT